MIFTNDEKTINNLLIKIKSGQKSALDTLFKLTNSKLTYFAYRYVYNKNSVEDVIGNAFLKVLQYAHTFDENKNGMSWLIKIVKNEALLMNRKEHSNESIDDFEIADNNYVDYMDNAVLINDVLYSLTDEEAIYFNYYFIYEYSIRKIAELMGNSKSSVARMLTKIKNKLINLIKDGTDSPSSIYSIMKR